MFDLRLLLWFLLLDTWAWPEESYERGSVLPSVHLPYSLSVLPSVRKFSQNWLNCVRGPYLVIYDSRVFLKKVILKMVKKVQRTRFFELFKKIKSLVLSGIGVKRKSLWSFNICKNSMAACMPTTSTACHEKSGSQLMVNNGSQTMRFKYSLIINTTLID